MKCDETRPACSRCTKKGLECAGYAQPLKWSYKHERPRTETLKGHQKLPELPAPLPQVGQTVEQQQEGHDHQQYHHNQEEQPAARPAAFEVEGFSPSCLLDLDYLGSVDGVFWGPGELDPAGSFDLADWPLDLAVGGIPGGSAKQNSNAYMSGQLVLSQEPLQALESVSSLPRELSGPGMDSTMRLVDNWFSEVCPAWSGFDSKMNMNRKLAEDLWHDSPSVFKSLQSMSASFLAARLPQMRRPALALLKAATHGIQAELEDLNSKRLLEAMPIGVIFSLLCVGTTVCWLDPRRAGWPFLQDAKRLLGRTLRQNFPLSPATAGLYDFFRKSLLYWDMLISFIYDPELDDPPDAPPPLRLPQHPCIDTGDTAFDSIPHPWTGVSSLTTHLFAESMIVCRNYRRRTNQLAGTVVSLWPALREVQQAKSLEEQLLQLQFPPNPPTQDTGDQRTPCLHLTHVAEAYQLASLLQLYITFPDLVSLRLPQETHHLFRRGVPWYKWIVPLTLRLTEVLERLPPDSGSRALQPLLCVCAATGLRYGSAAEQDAEHSGNSDSLRPLRPMESILDYLTLLDDPIEGQGGESFSVPQLALDVSKARSFVLRRLGVLKESLHPGPVRVAETLVKAIWAAYDEEPQGCADVHWIDIMEKKDLRTLFG